MKTDYHIYQLDIQSIKIQVISTCIHNRTQFYITNHDPFGSIS